VVTPTPSPIPSIIPTMTPTPTPTPVPTPPPSSCGSGGSCTAAQVATHNTAGNCWVYLSSNSKVYNITGYIASGSHPAGSSIIVQACGKDLYPYFITGAIGGHRHTNYALNTILSAYYIGPLQ
jgi:cytochrome b involved in lipid metabolism